MNSADDSKGALLAPPQASLEIESLNVDDLDIVELERRLELSITDSDVISAECYILSCCGSNCQSNSCGSYSSKGC